MNNLNNIFNNNNNNNFINDFNKLNNNKNSNLPNEKNLTHQQQCEQLFKEIGFFQGQVFEVLQSCNFRFNHPEIFKNIVDQFIPIKKPNIFLEFQQYQEQQNNNFKKSLDQEFESIKQRIQLNYPHLNQASKQSLIESQKKILLTKFQEFEQQQEIEKIHFLREMNNNHIHRI